MNRDERAQLLGYLWTKHVWPDSGDLKTLTLALVDDEDGGVGLTVTGDCEVEDLCEKLIEVLLGEEMRPPAWIALTATVYFDWLAKGADPATAGRLEENPTPTTQHGLMVLQVDDAGVYSTCWKMDLNPVIDLPEETEWSTDEEPRGDNVRLLQGLFRALVAVCGEQ